MYEIYKTLTYLAEPLFDKVLKNRIESNKEDPTRLKEKRGEATLSRPNGSLIWLHGASIGEAQSALVIINKLIKIYPEIKILVTTGTKTSAALMERNLPKNAIHQYYPLDHPKWITKFLTHWQPDCVLWMESELWPNMLFEISRRGIPATLINAHMSPKSYKAWTWLKPMAKKILAPFDKILCQTKQDCIYFKNLGGNNIIHTDNIKYSSSELSYNSEDYKILSDTLASRAIWLYASTHKGEEELACLTHQKLKKNIPNLLTIIIPRHPERVDNILENIQQFKVKSTVRTDEKHLPQDDTDIYIANTLGELGLFYRISPIACIGRSFSNDGGGGHNPIEAAQLNCAILHGPNTQNLQSIYDDMHLLNAAIKISDTEELYIHVMRLLQHSGELKSLQKKALEYSKSKINIIDNVMAELHDTLAGIQKKEQKSDTKCL